MQPRQCDRDRTAVSGDDVSRETDVLLTVAQRLDGANLAYMVSGSVAMNFYAQPRMTRDIDIVIELRPRDVPRLTEIFSADFYCDADMIRDALEHQGMFNLIHNTSIVKVDFIPRKLTPYREAEFSRRRQVVVEGTHIWIVTAEDLILSKLAWALDSNSEMQRLDVRNLVRSVVDLDWSYLDRWANELGVAERLSEARR